MNDNNKAEWVVLKVREGSENAVIKKLGGLLDCGLYTPFMPKKMKPIVRKGKVVETPVEICFPGYVFIRVAADAADFFRDVYRLIPVVGSASRFLYYGRDKRDVFMHGYEREALETLLDGNFMMGASIGFETGDRVKVISGPLMGKESRIIRVSKPQRMAVITTEFMGRVVETVLMLEVIEKVK